MIMDNNEDCSYRDSLDIQMRFKDVDLFGHVNNTVFLEYMDMGKVHYIENVLGDIFNNRRDALVIVNINIDFLQPAKFDEHLCVQTRVETVGVHSITFVQQVANTVTGSVKCRARVVMVGFDATTGESKEIPQSWKTRIAAHEGQVI